MTPEGLTAIGLSVQVGLWCALVGLPLAIALGWLLARRQFFGKTLLSGVVLVPMVLPPVVTGLMLLDALGRRSHVGGWLAEHGWPMSLSFTGAVVAALVVGLPLYVWSARAAFEAIDPRFEEVSYTLGVPPATTFWRVTLPLALPGLAAGAVLAFARGLGEFGATAVLAGNRPGETRTIALAVYSMLNAPDGEALARPLIGASCGLAFVSIAGYELLSRWQRTRLER